MDFKGESQANGKKSTYIGAVKLPKDLYFLSIQCQDLQSTASLVTRLFYAASMPCSWVSSLPQSYEWTAKEQQSSISLLSPPVSMFLV